MVFFKAVKSQKEEDEQNLEQNKEENEEQKNPHVRKVVKSKTKYIEQILLFATILYADNFSKI